MVCMAVFTAVIRIYCLLSLHLPFQLISDSFSSSPCKTQYKNYCWSPCTVLRVTPFTTSYFNVHQRVKFPVHSIFLCKHVTCYNFKHWN
jgi:hypothetical protein